MDEKARAEAQARADDWLVHGKVRDALAEAILHVQREAGSEMRRLLMEFGWDSTGDPLLWLRRRLEQREAQPAPTPEDVRRVIEDEMDYVPPGYHPEGSEMMLVRDKRDEILRRLGLGEEG